MSIIIQSPTPLWPGEVVVQKPIGLQAYIEFTEAWQAASKQADNYPRYMLALLPGLLACIEDWRLGGGFPNPVTPQNFPAMPQRDSMALFGAILGAISEQAKSALEAPNA